MQSQVLMEGFSDRLAGAPVVPPRQAATDAVTEKIFGADMNEIYRRTDRSFAILMPVQWAAAIGVALWLSPRIWEGTASSIHPHVWMALIFGGVLTSLPVALAVLRPGERLTRHVVAGSQMVMGSLLIHLSGGRLETHFFLFGSLAFIACYRDIGVLGTALAVAGVDHVARGLYLPQSLYGVMM